MVARLKVFAPFVLPQVGCALRRKKNWSVDSGVEHAIDSGKTNGVTPLNVSRNALLPDERT